MVSLKFQSLYGIILTMALKWAFIHSLIQFQSLYGIILTSLYGCKCAISSLFQSLYGIILTRVQCCICRSVVIFWFQSLYGIILTGYRGITIQSAEKISIPIWNYSNTFDEEYNYNPDDISIPIWNYSNPKYIVTLETFPTIISIPIWNYSNPNIYSIRNTIIDIILFLFFIRESI